MYGTQGLNGLRGLESLDMLGSFPPALAKGDNFVTSCLLSCRKTVPSENEFTLEAASFLLKSTPFFRKETKHISALESDSIFLRLPLDNERLNGRAN